MHKNNFDFLRFFFAFIVVLSHIVDLSLHPDIAYLKKYFDSHVSVTGFFIISGYLIAGSFIVSKTVKSYFVKRANRLLPAYIFVVLFSAIFFVFISSFSFTQYYLNAAWFKYLASNLSFLNFLQPCLPGVFLGNYLCTINGALWTIKVEVSFYLVLPFIIYWIQKTSKKHLVLIAVYLFGLLYEYGLTQMAISIPAKAAIFDVLKHQLPGFLTYFISGIAMYYYQDQFHKYKNYVSPLALIVFIVEYSLNLEILRPIAMAILILYVAYGFTFLNNWGKYGDFSYGIYIYHFPIIQTAVSLGLFTIYSPYMVGLGIISLVLVCSFLSWNLLEKRFLQRKIMFK
ncbi:MAG: acyltransferase [Bacteroidetes bacterium B1(2017)]|nr:MAG: acyltransferase [Bacteroidetes bacterium B1(2017)]